ncbi:pre-peptidase C-terminal domain-containing protein [Leptolyngbya sp. CCNP1308]|uniref:pre-peptidase C-terminal domain-containing protein n=1 Tax=Leptolyngbya sp. CCNP1308 TaxID=3110255 RepID=UPI002B1F0D92|nr:pre-peptidase C-terminal domain-containing protein [Leptolyngbya sp. CCNP1308]MEA5449754.1 pre-peptidase C-terminal domain-containing protein [Leptolyngbya sp. CCNP1308]
MGFLRLFPVGVVAPVALVGLLAGPTTLVARADTVLEEAGTIYPAESTYTFEGTAGQVMTITLASEDFDPVLSLTGPGEAEIATNDDFGGTLNSTIIVELPEDGTYTVVARSFSGQGGDYDLIVRTSTEFETTYAEAEAFALAEDYPEAIAAYTEAIGIDPDQSSAYLGRAQAILGQVYVEQGDAVEGPEDIPLEARELVIADFEQAATLFEASGSEDWAASLREQAAVLRDIESSN